jgi:rhamnulokinase
MGNEMSYGELTELASRARPFLAFIDPDDPMFSEPGDMPARIEAYAGRNGKTIAGRPETVVRIILESLALKYRHVLELLESVSGQHLSTIHVVGGGSENRLLNQFTADATGRVVLAGPTEATAVGNILMQAIGCGEIAGLAEAREVVRRSFRLARYEPGSRAPWDEAYARFEHMLSGQAASH